MLDSLFSFLSEDVPEDSWQGDVKSMWYDVAQGTIAEYGKTSAEGDAMRHYLSSKQTAEKYGPVTAFAVGFGHEINNLWNFINAPPTGSRPPEPYPLGFPDSPFPIDKTPIETGYEGYEHKTLWDFLQTNKMDMINNVKGIMDAGDDIPDDLDLYIPEDEYKLW